MAEVRYENATRVYPGAEHPAVDALTLRAWLSQYAPAPARAA